MDATSFAISLSLSVPATLVIVEAIKRMDFLNKKFIPALSVVIGVATSVVIAAFLGLPLVVGVFYGIIYGAGTTGAYKAVKDLATK